MIAQCGEIDMHDCSGVDGKRRYKKISAIRVGKMNKAIELTSYVPENHTEDILRIKKTENMLCEGN